MTVKESYDVMRKLCQYEDIQMGGGYYYVPAEDQALASKLEGTGWTFEKDEYLCGWFLYWKRDES